MVKPDKMTDDDIVLTCREIVKKIENEMEYPGQIKVNVIREVRVVDFAK
jgi:ribonuclease Y